MRLEQLYLLEMICDNASHTKLLQNLIDLLTSSGEPQRGSECFDSKVDRKISSFGFRLPFN